jgi:acetoin utilization deacetylase AcuC-like enzyme
VDTLIFRDDLFLAHDPGPGHPENAARLRAVYDDLDARAVRGTRVASPRPASRRELERVHRPEHIDRVAATAGKPRVRLDPDTATSADSYEAALRGSGAVLAAAEATFAREARGAFALVRPPGHHAEAAAAMGFCLFNNVAVAAAHAVDELGCRRVLVLDPDVHHGNGTQNMFYGDRDVLYVSSHRFPFYPGTGWFDEVGAGEGEGYTVNLPLPPGMGDADFLHLYRAVVGPIVDEYRPEMILVSAGFDTWKDDPIGGMAMTAEGYTALCGLFHRWSEAHCPGRLVFALEGGYDPAGVIAGVRAALEITAGARPAPEGIEAGPSPIAREAAAGARRVLSPYWRSLRDR